MSNPFQTSYGLDLSDAGPIVVKSVHRGRRTVCETVNKSASVESDAVCAGAIPVQNSLTVRLEVPVSSVNKAWKVFPSLLDVQLPFPLENCIFDFIETRKTTSSKIKTLAVAVLKKSLDSYLAACRESGFDPELIDHEGLALWHGSFVETPDSEVEFRVVICLKKDNAVIITGGNGVFFNAYDTAIPETALFRNNPEALAGLINRTLLPDIPKEGKTQWFFCGAQAEDKQFILNLHKCLEKERPGPSVLPKEPVSFLARTLALRALSRKNGLNLRKKEFAHPRFAEITRRRLHNTFLLMFFTGMLMSAISLGWNSFLQKQRLSALDRVTNMAKTLAPESAIQHGTELFQAERDVARTTETLRPFSDMFDVSMTQKLNDIITEGKHYAVTYTAISLQKGNITISGNAHDWDNCEKLKERLNFPGIRLTLNRRESLADSTIHFTITGQADNEP